jgi:hypothetical protein
MDSYSADFSMPGGARDVARNARARSAAGAAHDAAFDITRLQQQLDRLALTCEAMWELIKTHTNLTDTDLMGKMAQLDLSDGVVDGKVARGPAICPGCDRPNSRRHELCLYCGAPLKTKPFE